MKYKRSFSVGVLIRLYVIVVLGVAATFSPPSFSIIPMLFLVVYAYLLLKRIWPLANLAADLYLFLVLPLMYEMIVPSLLSVVFSLPLLMLIGQDMERLAQVHQFSGSSNKWHPSGMLIGVIAVMLIALMISIFLNKANVAITVVLLVAYMEFLIIRVVKDLKEMLLQVEKLEVRGLAGEKKSFTVLVHRKGKCAGWFHPVYENEWIAVSPERLMLDEAVELNIAVELYLAGPASVQINGSILDKWGLLERSVEFDAAEIQVVPRARHAVWLAERFLETGGAGGVMTASSVKIAHKLAAGSRSGFEYVGNRQFQPGDSLKHIDWKHSLKLQEIVVKEFEVQQTSAAILMVNLTASDAEEADRLVHALISSAITLAKTGVPTILAGYTQNDVLSVTESLDPRELVVRSLSLSQKIEIVPKVHKYFSAGDPLAMMSTRRRLETLKMDSLEKLIELMQLEFEALQLSVDISPVTIAMKEALMKNSKHPTVVFVSAMNHDEDAVHMAEYNLTVRDLKFTHVPLDGKASIRHDASKLQTVRA